MLKRVLVVTIGVLLLLFGTESKGGGDDDTRDDVDVLEATLNRVYEELAENAVKRECIKAMEPVEKKVDKMAEDYTDMLTEYMKVSFEQLSNFTDYNKLKMQEQSDKFNEMALNISAESYDILQSSRDKLEKCNQTLLEMLKGTVMANAMVPLTQEDRSKLSSLENNMAIKQADVSISKNGKVYRLDPDLNKIMSSSRDYEELLWAWNGWHDAAGSCVKEDYAETVSLMSRAAEDRGHKDIAEVWQLIDFGENMEEEMDELMQEMMPLYTQLHAYVRSKLFDFYRDRVEDEGQKAFFSDKSNPIPVHLLGDMYGQEWDNIENIVLPFPNKNVDITKEMKAQNYTVEKMFKMAEEFFVSLGFDPMTKVFWEESIVQRQPNITMQCHPSAFDMQAPDDYRILMCAEVNLGHLQTVHHEMGHIVYYMSYRHQHPFFRDGANAAFHEAIGDTIGLSVTTDNHLKKVGLLPDVGGDDQEIDLNKLMRDALLKVAFLPFGYVIDKWRYRVFRGEFGPEDYNKHWWNMRLKYQGVIPPTDRSNASLFDAGAKYHVPAFVPYSRYFFSFVGQFQFQEALCRQASHQGPLYQCDIYQSIEAGELLKGVLSEGRRTPWRELMGNFTGSSGFNSSALLSYFQPLHTWLIEQNKDVPVGWQSG